LWTLAWAQEKSGKTQKTPRAALWMTARPHQLSFSIPVPVFDETSNINVL
jgi:hypothetical protein